MKRTILMSISVIALLTGCAVYPVATPNGYVYQAEVIPPAVTVVPYPAYYGRGYWPEYYGRSHHRYHGHPLGTRPHRHY